METRPTKDRKLGINLDEWTAAIHQLHKSRVQTIPPGWMSIQQWAELKNIKRTTGENQLRGLYCAGLVEKRKFNIIQSTGRIGPIVFYKLKKK